MDVVELTVLFAVDPVMCSTVLQHALSVLRSACEAQTGKPHQRSKWRIRRLGAGQINSMQWFVDFGPLSWKKTDCSFMFFFSHVLFCSLILCYIYVVYLCLFCFYLFLIFSRAVWCLVCIWLYLFFVSFGWPLSGACVILVPSLRQPGLGSSPVGKRHEKGTAVRFCIGKIVLAQFTTYIYTIYINISQYTVL